MATTRNEDIDDIGSTTVSTTGTVDRQGATGENGGIASGSNPMPTGLEGSEQCSRDLNEQQQQPIGGQWPNNQQQQNR
jgi:hypothetical protein